MTLYRVFILPLFTKLFLHNFASKMKKNELGVFFVLNLGVHDDKNVGGVIILTYYCEKGLYTTESKTCTE